MATVHSSVECCMKTRESEQQWYIAVTPPTRPAVEGNHTAEHLQKIIVAVPLHRDAIFMIYNNNN